MSFKSREQRFYMEENTKGRGREKIPLFLKIIAARDLKLNFMYLNLYLTPIAANNSVALSWPLTLPLKGSEFMS